MSGARRPRLSGGEKSFRWPVSGTQTELDAAKAIARQLGVSFNRFVLDALHEKMRAAMQGNGSAPLDPAVAAMLGSAEDAALSTLQAIRIARAASANRIETVPETPDTGGHLLDEESALVAA